MKKIPSRLSLLLMAAIFLAQTPPPTKTSVAVYQIKAKGAVDSSMGSALTSLLSSSLTASPRLNIIEDTMLKTVMERQAMNASDACDDTTCQVAIGKLVQAQKIIAGDLVKLGSKYILSLKLINVQTGANEFTTEDQCGCTEDQLDQLVEVAGAKIRNHFGEQIPVPPLPRAEAGPATLGPKGPSSGPAPTAALPANYSHLPGPSMPNKSRIYLYYKESHLERMDPVDARNCCQFWIDKQFVANHLINHQCFDFELDPGDHLIGAPYKKWGFSLATDPGKNYFIEMSINSPSGWSLRYSGESVQESQAVQWAQECQKVTIDLSKEKKSQK